MLTTKQQIEKRAIQQGIQQGMQEVVHQIAKNMLIERIPVAQVSQLTGLDVMCLKEILKEISKK